MEGTQGPVTGNLLVYLTHPTERSTILIGILLESPPFGPRQGQTTVIYGGKSIEVRVQEYNTGDTVDFYFQVHDTEDYWHHITRQQSRIEPGTTNPHYVDRQIIGQHVASRNTYMVTVMAHAGIDVRTFSLLPVDQPFRLGDGVSYRLRVLKQAPFLELRLGV